MTAKERLHQLIDDMHDDQAEVLLIDLEERTPLSDTERAEIDRARAELRSGKGIPHEEAMVRLRPTP